MTSNPTPDPTHGLSVQQADALWDAVAIPGPTEPTFPVQHERVCRAVAGILDELAPTAPSAVDQTTRDRIAAAMHSELTALPVEIRRESGRIIPPFTDAVLHVLRGLTLRELEQLARPNTTPSRPKTPPPADRAAVLREAAEELGRMDYDTDSNDYGYDTYRDAWNGGVMDGADLLRRLADEAQQPAVGARHPKCVLCGHRTCTLGQPCGVIATERGDLPEPCGCTGVGARQPDTETRTPCGPAPDQCAPDGEPCADHERQQAHAEGEHAFCEPECGETEPTVEETVRSHVTTLHLIGEQLAAVESWFWNHLADVRKAAQQTAERPRCPHCQMPHDLGPGSSAVLACASIRASIADRDAVSAVPGRSAATSTDEETRPDAHVHDPDLPAIQPEPLGDIDMDPDDVAEAAEETVHGCPPDGSGLTPCCGRTPFELPRTDRMSVDPALVTCRGAE